MHIGGRQDFEKQVALVTGASSGIGCAIAAALVRKGACVWAVGRRRAVLEASLAAAGCNSHVRCFEVDLASDEQMETLGLALDATDRLDVVVHSAGLLHLGRFEHLAAERFDDQYRVNVRAPLMITQRALPALRKRKGQVVFINSTAGLRATAGAAQYSATKFALRAVADSLREEVNSDGVRVLSVYVGRTATPMQAAVCAYEGRSWHPEKLLQPEDVALSVLNALAMPRTAEIYELNVRPMAPAGPLIRWRP